MSLLHEAPEFSLTEKVPDFPEEGFVVDKDGGIPA